MLGVSMVDFKVTPQNGGGDLLILENVFRAKGGRRATCTTSRMRGSMRSKASS
jgi:hypothetical protein